MNQFLFACRNILDKATKVMNNVGMLKFYWDTYVVSAFDRLNPHACVVSYPKCGRTWLRFMLTRYLERIGSPSPTFKNRGVLGLPGNRTLRFEHDQGNWVPAPLRPDQLGFNPVKYENKKVVFLVRDPRDILISSWYHLTYRERIYRRGLSAFIRDDLVGIDKVIAFMNMWIDGSDCLEDFFLLSYEQFHSDSQFTFESVLRFLGVPVDHHASRAAVEASSFERMKNRESQGSMKEPWMRAGAGETEHGMKVRKGKVGGFLEELTPGDAAFLEREIRNNLSSRLLPLFAFQDGPSGPGYLPMPSGERQD